MTDEWFDPTKCTQCGERPASKGGVFMCLGCHDTYCAECFEYEKHQMLLCGYCREQEPKRVPGGAIVRQRYKDKGMPTQHFYGPFASADRAKAWIYARCQFLKGKLQVITLNSPDSAI